MKSTLVECVPNFSEGRRSEVVEAIVAAVREVPDVVVLDYSMDADHNRSVLTFVGTVGGVEEAAFAAIQKAAALIDMDAQEGEHPRIGATDVVPFIPISGVTMADCVAIANRLGKRVAEELSIPVYLYEQAATRPERENLASLRKGEYEGLKNEIERSPDRAPDFGPSRLGKAGATVIGARNFLVAYNVYLDSDDVSIAKKIAKAVRHSSGGLRYVKGLGLLVDGQAQVSMNLTNTKGTPIYRVVEMIRREAARYGTAISHSELIGLVPQEALVDAAQWYLQLDDFSPAQILEQKMNTEMSGTQAAETEEEESFLEALASGNPTPGGGSAAAYAGAMAAGLAAMVARVTIGKKKYASVKAEMQAVIEEADRLRKALDEAVSEDAQAFERVMAAYQMPKSTDAEIEARFETIQSATIWAAQVPLEVAGKAVQVLQLVLTVVEQGNINAITDAGSAAALVRSALTAAGMNVRINLSGIQDTAEVDRITTQLAGLEKQAAKLLSQVQEAVEGRGKISGFQI